MCGIVGYIGDQPAWPIVVEGLRRLEYRGYDSAGVAVLQPEGGLQLRKTVGRVVGLLHDASCPDPVGSAGLGHTRWATHGRPSEANAHPHTDCTGRIAVAHNGIVENYLNLRIELQERGHRFTSETDTEVISHLIEEGMNGGLSLPRAVLRMGEQVQGAAGGGSGARGRRGQPLRAAPGPCRRGGGSLSPGPGHRFQRSAGSPAGHR